MACMLVDSCLVAVLQNWSYELRSQQKLQATLPTTEHKAAHEKLGTSRDGEVKNFIRFQQRLYDPENRPKDWLFRKEEL